MCAQCTITRSFGDERFLVQAQVARKLDELAVRVTSDIPVRVCDDPLGWDWRAFVAERRQGVT